MLEKSTMDKSQERNPYLDGRREWNERYGNYIKQVKIWKTIAFIALLITLSAVIGLIYIGSQNRLVPYVVEVDKLGNAQSINYAKQSNLSNQQVIKYSLAEFIQNFRTLYGDAKTQKAITLKIYRYLSPSHAAYNTINEYFRANSPFERLQTERVRVKIASIVPMNQDTYQIDWKEIVSDPRGLQLRVEHFKASVTLLLAPPSSEQEIIKNPIGLYVKEFNFSKVIQ